MIFPIHASFLLLASATACASRDSRGGGPRHLITAVPHAEEIRVGSPVLINREPIGKVSHLAHIACDSGVVLVLEITRPDAPLLQGTVAQIQPDLFEGERVALILPPEGATRTLPESANVPGWSPAATAAERHRALKLVLQAIGLAGFTPLMPHDTNGSAATAGCAAATP